jgi:hypothetical protein
MSEDTNKSVPVSSKSMEPRKVIQWIILTTSIDDDFYEMCVPSSDLIMYPDGYQHNKS